MSETQSLDKIQAQEFSSRLEKVLREAEKVIVGQRSMMEGLLLGNLERAKNVQLLLDAGRLTELTALKAARRKLRESSLEDLINHTRKSNCVAGFTDEVARMIQRCRNSVHPGRVLRGDEVLDAFDKRAADLALGFPNVICPLIARS